MKRKRHNEKALSGCKRFKSGVLAVAVISFAGMCTAVGAFEIPTGSEELEIRWDNTLRYTLSQRVKSQNKDYLNSPNIDDGDRNFDKGIVSNRLDLLSELDVIYNKEHGVRLSGAGWYDQAYHNHLDSDSAFTSNHLSNGQPAIGLSPYAERNFAGPRGELLDAFAFTKFTISDIPVNAKVGRHTVYWGESLLGNGGTHGISYGQSAIDVAKAFAQPGVELKELFRPLNQVSVQIQPTPELSIAAQHYLEWESYRFPAAGSYWSFADPLGEGSESLIAGFDPAVGFIRFTNGSDIEPGDARDWGISARWSPEWMVGTLGVYYRKFSDKIGQMHLSPVAGNYNWAFASDIDLVGVSFAKQFAGISVGSELSYRFNMPLVSDAAFVAPWAGGPPPPGAPPATAIALPGSGETLGTRGDTWHAVLNFLYLYNRTPMFDKAELLAEFTWNRWQRVSQHEELFKGRSGYTAIDRVTKDFFGGALNFTPTWYQVLAGVDLSMPLSIYSGLSGNSAVAAGGNEGTGQYAFGLSADFFQKYKADLKYVGCFGNYETTPAGVVTNGPDFAALRDRDMVALTLKTNF